MHKPLASSADVFDALHELMHAFRNQMMAASVQDHSELTFTELRILMRVGRHPDQTQKDLIAHSRTDKAQMTRTLAQLQARGWLLRTPSPSDKRVRCLALSAQGQALFQRLTQRQEGLASALLGDMTPEAQAQLLGLLAQARQSVQAHALPRTAPVSQTPCPPCPQR